MAHPLKREGEELVQAIKREVAKAKEETFQQLHQENPALAGGITHQLCLVPVLSSFRDGAAHSSGAEPEPPAMKS